MKGSCRMKWALLLLCCLICCGAAVGQQLPSVFLVGDSISIYYSPDLQSNLAGEASFSRKTSATPEPISVQLGDPAVQGGDSRAVLAYLRGRLQETTFHPD